MAVQRGGRRHQHGDHHHLGDHGADGGVDPAGSQVLPSQPFVDDRRLLVEDHPRHYHGAHVGGHEAQVVSPAQRSHRTETGSGGVQARVGAKGGEQERQLEQPERQPDPLDPPVAPRHHHQGQEDGGGGDGHAGRDALHQAHAGQARQLCDQGPGGAHEQQGDREEGPFPAEAVLYQLGVPLAGGDPEPHRQLHDEVQHGDEGHLEGQQGVAPAGPRLCGGDDAAGIGVGQHHHQPRADGGEEHGQHEGVAAPGADDREALHVRSLCAGRSAGGEARQAVASVLSAHRPRQKVLVSHIWKSLSNY